MSKNQSDLTAVDIELMAHVVYGEARGEPREGQVAIAAVILNRIFNPSFPDTIKEVIFQPEAFTAVSDGQFKLQPDQAARQAVYEALEGKDPTEGALYYWNPQTATNNWIKTRTIIKQIGRHVFAK